MMQTSLNPCLPILKIHEIDQIKKVCDCDLFRDYIYYYHYWRPYLAFCQLIKY